MTPEQDTGIIGSFGAGLKRGAYSSVAGTGVIGEGIETAFPGSTGLSVEEWAKNAQSWREKRESVEGNTPVGLFSDAPFSEKAKTVASTLGESLPATVAGLGLIGAGTIAGGPVGGAIGAAGAAAMYTPQIINENAEAQIREHGKIKDWDKLAGATALNVGVETFTDRITLGLAGVLKKPVTPFLKEAVKKGVDGALTSAFRRGGTAAVGNMITEGSEEVIQSIATRWQAEMPVGGPGAGQEYIESAVMGGLLGGMVGGPLGGVTGYYEGKTNKAQEQADKDAREESDAFGTALKTNPGVYDRRRDDEAKPGPNAGLIEDFTRPPEGPTSIPMEDSTDTKNVDRLFKEKPSDLTESEYRDAITKLNDGKKISIDKIKKTLGVRGGKAKQIFEALRDRGDAGVSGGYSQYLRLKPQREYVIAGLEEEDTKPFRVATKGREVGDYFKTEEEAKAFAEGAGLTSYEVTRAKTPQRHGIYEYQIQNGKPISKKLVKAYSSASEAQAAAVELDPQFGAATNEKNAKLAEEIRLERNREIIRKELGPIQKTLQAVAEGVVGAGRVNVQLAPLVNDSYLRSVGVPEEQIPAGLIIEGVTIDSQKKAMRNVIGLSHDLVSPSLTPEQRTQKLTEVLNHELVHALRNLDLLTKKEWDTLYRTALTEKVAGKPYTHMQAAVARSRLRTEGAARESDSYVAEEGIAEMLRAYQRDPAGFRSGSKGILKKLGEFIRKLVGLGKRMSADEVIDAIYGGQMAKRQEGHGGLGNRYAGNPVFASVRVPGFYMKSDRWLSGQKIDKAPVDQWKGTLRNAKWEGKDNELYWLRLIPWMEELAAQKKMDGQKPLIEKGEILDYIRANGMQVEESQYGDRFKKTRTPEEEDELASLTEMERPEAKRAAVREWETQEDGGFFDGDFQDWLSSIEAEEDGFGPINVTPIPPLADTTATREYIRIARRQAELVNIEQENNAHHAHTTQIGGSDYTEIALHIPGLEAPAFSISSHMGGLKNSIVHARFKTRIIDNKKTLFIEEIQGDLHQRAGARLRKDRPAGPDNPKIGYRQPGDDELVKELKQKHNDAEESANRARAIRRHEASHRDEIFRQMLQERGAGNVEEADRLEKLYDEMGVQREELLQKELAARELEQKARAELDAARERQAIPDAPFKTSWDELAFKRIVRYAIEEGFDQVAWHGSHLSVAETENWGNLEKIPTQKEDGSTEDQYWITDAEGVKYQNMTGIVNFYLKRLPMLVKKNWQMSPVFKGPETEATNKFSDIFGTWYDVESFMANYDIPENLVRKFRLADQVYHNMRAMDFDNNAERINAAFSKAGITMEEMDKALGDDVGGMGIPTIDEHGNPNHARWLLPLTPEFKQSALDYWQAAPGKTTPGGMIEGMSVSYSAVQEQKEVKTEIDNAKSNPQFKRWFTGSKMQLNGEPWVVWHHGSFDREENGIPKMPMHFGTKQAATERAFGKRREDAISGVKVERDEKSGEYYWITADGVTSFDVGRGNPLYYDPTEALMQGQIWAERDADVEDQLSHEDLGVMTPVFLNIKNPLKTADMVNEEQWAPTIKRAIEKGHDGIMYMNAFEDKGSWSVIVFEPTQIKSIYAKEFDSTNPDINYSSVRGGKREGAREENSPVYAATAPLGARVPATTPPDRLTEIEQKMTYNNLAPRIAKLFGSGFSTSWGAKVTPKVEDTFISMQDRMLSMGKQIDRMKANGGFISNENDTYLRDTLFTGRVDAQITDNEKALYSPVIDAVKALRVTSADARDAARLTPSAQSIIDNYTNPKQALAELFLYAQHAKERNAKMRERNRDMLPERQAQFDAGSGMYDDEADIIMNWFQSKPFLGQLTDISNKVQAIIASTNDIRVAGKLNPDFRKMVKKDGTPVDTYKYYVPLRSWIDEHLDQDDDALEFAKAGKGFNIRGKEDFSATGRQTLGAHLIEHAILQNEEAIVRAEKNAVGRSFVQLITDNPAAMQDVAEIITKPRKVVYDWRSGRVKMAFDQSFLNDPSVLKVKDGLNQIYVKIKDPRIAKALGSRSQLGNAGVGPVMKGLLYLNRYLAAARTSYNPEFLVSNFLRDLNAALLNVSEVELTGVKREILASVTPALKAVWHAQRTGLYNTPWAQTFDQFRKRGGMTAFYGIRSLDDTLGKMNKALQGDMTGNLGKSMQAMKALGKFVGDANLMFENGTRLATYKVLRDRFLSMVDRTDPKQVRRAEERAAFISKNLTVNFNAGGDMKPVINALYLFYNASLQGSLALINPMLRSKKVRAMWLGVIAAGAMQDILAQLFGDHDDDGKLVYDKIPEWVLEHNMIIMDPFGLTERGYFQIPLPYLMNGLWNTGRGLSRGISGRATVGETANTVLGTLAESLNPFGSANSFLNFVLPTVFDPLADLGQNENFMDRPIYMPASPYGGDARASQRYWNNTSPLYVSIADWISKIGGGEGKYIPGSVMGISTEISPNVIDYAIDFAFGGAGGFLTRMYDLTVPNEAGGKGIIWGQNDEFSANDVPFLRKAYGNVTTQNNLESYIKNRDRVLQVRSELKEAARQGDRQGYMDIMQSYPEEYKLAARINKIENARKKLATRIRKVRENKKLSDAQKDKMIADLKKKQNELVGTANQLFD